MPDAGEAVDEIGHGRRPGRVELGGRLVEDEDVRPHRDDAGDRDPLLLAARQREGLALREVADPSRRSRTASMRPSISARGTPRFSSPNASSSRTVSFEADSWLAGVAKTIPTRPRSWLRVGRARVDAADRHRPADGRARRRAG